MDFPLSTYGYVKQHKYIIKSLSKFYNCLTREGPVNMGKRFWISSENEEGIKGIGTGVGVLENEIFLYLEEGILI